MHSRPLPRALKAQAPVTLTHHRVALLVLKAQADPRVQDLTVPMHSRPPPRALKAQAPMTLN